jgi:hypothetical protein
MKEFAADKQCNNLVNKLRTMRLFIDKKQNHGPRVLTEEKLDDIGARLEHTHRKSLKSLAQDTNVSKPNVREATQLVKLSPCKRTAFRALQPRHPVGSIPRHAAARSSWQDLFCSWFLQSLVEGEIDPQLAFYPDEAWFRLLCVHSL